MEKNRVSSILFFSLLTLAVYKNAKASEDEHLPLAKPGIITNNLMDLIKECTTNLANSSECQEAWRKFEQHNQPKVSIEQHYLLFRSKLFLVHKDCNVNN